MPLATHAEYSAAKLKSLAQQLRESAAVLESAGETMPLLGASELRVKHADSINRAMKGLDAFGVAVRDAIREFKPKKKRVLAGDTSGDK